MADKKYSLVPTIHSQTFSENEILVDRIVRAMGADPDDKLLAKAVWEMLRVLPCVVEPYNG